MESEEEQDGGNGKELASVRGPNEVGEEHEFKDSELNPPQKRKSPLRKLGIPKPQERELTEEEQKKAEELASELNEYVEIRKPEDLWKGFGSENVF